MLKDNQRDALRSFKRDLRKQAKPTRKPEVLRKAEEREAWSAIKAACVTLRRG